ncbi:MAG TPA: PH domain-containing protein [Pseudomonadales bacterium]|nr:PH domain-containing protein [Pseudomonadales bacterium]
MGYVERHLLPGERVLYKTRLHWVLFARPALVFLIGAGLTIAVRYVEAQPEAARWAGWIGLGIMAIGLLWGFVHWVELRTSEFAVTTTRVIFKVGLVARYTTELLLSKVESIAVQQSLTGRILDYGDLTVIGTGGTREVFRRVRDPITFRNYVQQVSTTQGAPAGPERRP